MIIEYRYADFSDSRGKITDLLTNTPVENVTLITTAKDGVRGNHYHVEATVYVYVISGKFKVVSKSVTKFEKTQEEVLEAGALVTFYPYDLHALVALEDSSFLIIAHGKRGGKLTIAETLV